MSYYNESLYDVGNDLYTMTYATNEVSHGLYASILILGSIFLIIFMILKYRQNQNNVSLLISSFVCLFLSIILNALDLIGYHILILCMVATIGFTITYKMTED